MKKETKKKFIRICIAIIFVILIGVIVFQKIQFHRTIRKLTTLDTRDVVSLKISFAESPTIFRSDDPIVDDFLQAITDIRAYTSSPKAVVSFEHTWFVEIFTEKGSIQMSCYIPADEKETVLGVLGKFKSQSALYYGGFESQQLFEWYQQYHERWLKPGK